MMQLIKYFTTERQIHRDYIRGFWLHFQQSKLEYNYQMNARSYQTSMFRIACLIQIICSLMFIAVVGSLYHVHIYLILRAAYITIVIGLLFLERNLNQNILLAYIDLVTLFFTFSNQFLAYYFFVIEDVAPEQINYIAGATQSLTLFLHISVCFHWYTKCLQLIIFTISVGMIGDLSESVYLGALIVVIVCSAVVFRFEDANKRNSFVQLEKEFQNTIACKNLFDACVRQSIIVLTNNSVSYVNNYCRENLQNGNQIMELLHNISVEGQNLFNLLPLKTTQFEYGTDYELIYPISQYVGQNSATEASYQISVANCIWERLQSTIIIMTDVSDKVRNEKLQLMDQYKDQLLATVSHDLKTPLNSITMMTEIIRSMLQTTYDKNEVLKLVEEVKNNEQLLLSLVNDLLDINQINRGTFKLSPHSFALAQTMNNVYCLFHTQAEMKSIQLKINCPHDISLYNDENRLKQILINMLSNALKFTMSGSITVTVIEVDDSLVEISVKDTGVGIPDDIQKRLFTMYNTFNIKNQNGKGMGIGLALCKRLCALIGPSGDIDLESDPKGSEFKFKVYKYLQDQRVTCCLDQILVEDSINQVPTFVINSPTHHHEQYHLLSKKSVLLVDDTPINLLALKAMLQRYFAIFDFEITEAFNGRQAIQICQQKTFDFVFMDINMPLMNGLECIRQIRQLEISQKRLINPKNKDDQNKQDTNKSNKSKSTDKANKSDDDKNQSDSDEKNNDEQEGGAQKKSNKCKKKKEEKQDEPEDKACECDDKPKKKKPQVKVDYAYDYDDEGYLPQHRRPHHYPYRRYDDGYGVDRYRHRYSRRDIYPFEKNHPYYKFHPEDTYGCEVDCPITGQENIYRVYRGRYGNPESVLRQIITRRRQNQYYRRFMQPRVETGYHRLQGYNHIQKDINIEDSGQEQVNDQNKSNQDCFQVFDQCDFKGSTLNICGEFPQLNVLSFKIFSFKIPDNLSVRFFKDQNIVQEVEGINNCLEQPYELILQK